MPPTHSRTSSVILNLEDDGMSSSGAIKSATLEKNHSLPISENDLSLSSSSSSNSDAGISSLGMNFKNEHKMKPASKPSNENIVEIMEDKKFQQNITFGQLGFVLLLGFFKFETNLIHFTGASHVICMLLGWEESYVTNS